MAVSDAIPLHFEPACGAVARAALGYRDGLDAILDTRGRTVRQAPWRRTVMLDLENGERVFRKHRWGRPQDFRAEWAALRELQELGLAVPTAWFRAERGRDSVLGMAAVPGRPAVAMLAEGLEVERLLGEIADVVARLHGAGWAYRDLYWNHVFAEPEAEGVWLVDVERAFRPGSDFERWRVKDLAGLVSSLPSGAGVSDGDVLRALACPAALEERVLAKAERIRGHVTKYPG